MKIAELRQKPKEELEAIYHDLLRRVDESRFAGSQGKQKNVKEIANIKKDIARILTLLREVRAEVSAK